MVFEVFWSDSGITLYNTLWYTMCQECHSSHIMPHTAIRGCQLHTDRQTDRLSGVNWASQNWASVGQLQIEQWINTCNTVQRSILGSSSLVERVSLGYVPLLSFMLSSVGH